MNLALDSVGSESGRGVGEISGLGVGENSERGEQNVQPSNSFEGAAGETRSLEFVGQANSVELAGENAVQPQLEVVVDEGSRHSQDSSNISDDTEDDEQENERNQLEDMDDELRLAIEISHQESLANSEHIQNTNNERPEEEIEEDIRLAIEMSIREEEEKKRIAIEKERHRKDEKSFWKNEGRR